MCLGPAIDQFSILQRFLARQGPHCLGHLQYNEKKYSYEEYKVSRVAEPWQLPEST